MVSDTTLWNTPVKIEFNLPKQVCQYNVRENLHILLEIMKQVDTKLKVTSAVAGQIEWNDFNLLPEDEEFNEHFQIKEFGYRKFKKVTVHMKMTTSLHINRIKYRSEVKDHLFQNDIWFKPDRFETKVESSPGIITMVHPKLVNRDDYKLEIEEALQKMLTQVQISGKDDSEQLIEQYDQQIVGDQKTPPKFYLEPSIKKWRDIKAEVLRVNCAKIDSECLKFLLAAASEKGFLQRGVFIPEGLHLIEGKELVYTILQKHEQFTQNIIGVPLSGITYRDFSTKQPDTEKNIRDLLHEIPGVISVETLRDRNQMGHYLILLNKTMEDEVMKKLETMMASLYKCQTGQARMIIAGTKKIRHPEKHRHGVLTYAEILSDKFQYQPHNDAKRHSSPPSSGPIVPGKQSNLQVPGKKTSKDNRQQEHMNTVGKHNENKVQEFSKLIQKIEKMATQQDKLEKAQATLQKVQEKNNNLIIQKIKQAEESNREDKIHTMIDKKFDTLQAEYENTLKATTRSLKQEMDTALDTKIEKLSDQVANQIGIQILDMFKQFMLPKDASVAPARTGDMDTNLVTQDGTTANIQVGIDSEQKPQLIQIKSTNLMDGTTSDELSDSKPPIQKQCSPHDTYLNEQSFDK